MTGYVVCQKIRETWPANQLPIMMLTAKNQVSDLVAGLEAGANDYLSKPIEKDELLARVKTLINIKQLQTEKAQIRHTLERYLPKEVVNQVLGPEGSKLGGERRKITILTSDIRGFTAQSERLSPEEVIKIINLYLGYMTDVITKYQGTIDEFMGDGILVLFGAPTTREDDAKRAVACAIAMQLTMSTINDKMKELDLPPLAMGIGINTGEVVVGNIGSETRCKYGVVGSHVNLTYRIESYTTGGEIFISEATLKELGSTVRIDGKKLVLAKGVKEPFTIYQIGGISGEYNLFLPQEEEVFLPLPVEIPIQYMLLEGKHLSNTLLCGSLVQLSAKGAKVRCGNGEQQGVPDVLSNLKINLLNPNNQLETSEDVYAKVCEKPAEIGSFYIHFTAKPLEVEARLDVLYKLIQVKG
jgi:class 3 adenylate cyclase